MAARVWEHVKRDGAGRFVRMKTAVAETTRAPRVARAQALYPIVAFLRFSRNDTDVTASTGHKPIINALFFSVNEVLL